jgi:malate dehydrogenase (oxaloacetate-decarboxylating)(NADP+)
VVNQDMVKSMARNPLILTLANPEPEILPELVREVRPDAIIATGRSDYPNQVNNVLCFPYIFRGALDVGATTINLPMKIACVRALAELAHAASHDEVAQAYGGETHSFGVDYIIPKPFDPRLMVDLPLAVAKAAVESGVATRPKTNWDEYRHHLHHVFHHSGEVIAPIFNKATANPKRITLCEGEEENVLRAAKQIANEGIGHPILIGRPAIIERRMAQLKLNMVPHKDFDIIDPSSDERYTTYWQTYHSLTERQGVSPDLAKLHVRTNTTIIGALTVYLGDSDTMVAGTIGSYEDHLNDVKSVLGQEDSLLAAMSILLSERGPVFLCDTFVNSNPTSWDIAEMTLLAIEQVRNFGMTPKVALISHSNFGSRNCDSALKMRDALLMIQDEDNDVEVEGEMTMECALNPTMRRRLFPNSRLTGVANLLIMPNVESAQAAYDMMRILGNAQVMGPILLGLDKPAHIVSSHSSVRDIVNMAVFSVVDAQEKQELYGAP